MLPLVVLTLALRTRSNFTAKGYHGEALSLRSNITPKAYPLGALLPRKAKAITLAAVGDVMLARYEGREIAEYGYRYPFRKVLPILRKQDCFYGNLECVISNRPYELHKPILLRALPGEERSLRGLPHPVFSLANNHSMDCGRKGLADTMFALNKVGAHYCGAAIGSPFAPFVGRVRGLRLAFIGFSDFAESAPGDQPSVAYYDEEKLKAAITAARSRADVVIVCAHWGVEGSSEVSVRQKMEAKFLAGCGADLILGCHPHVVEPSEWLPAPDGRRCYVIYSMGDFVFDTRKPKEQNSDIWLFQMDNRGVQQVRLRKVRIVAGRPELRPQ